MNDSTANLEPTIAIDARLASGTSTGDSTYWTGLLHGLAEMAPGMKFLLLSNTDRPAGIPAGPFLWRKIPARSNRWWSLVAFPVVARRLGARVLHTQYSLSPLVRRGGITTVHDVSFYVEPSWFKPRDALLLRKSVPSSVQRAAAVITVSETSRTDIERFIPQAVGKTHVTPLACPPWITPVDVETRSRTVADLEIEGPFVLTVSTRWPRKNMELAVEAMSRLDADLPHQLVLTGKAGWGDQRPGTRGKAVGYVDNATLSALYSAASLYLAPSRHEGFGIPLLEAFRCGCPVLSSCGGSLPEVAGDAAVIENSWEADVWAARIAELLRSQGTLDDLAQRGHLREREFSWKETAAKTLAVYRRVANAPTGTSEDPREPS